MSAKPGKAWLATLFFSEPEDYEDGLVSVLGISPGNQQGASYRTDLHAADARHQLLPFSLVLAQLLL